MNDAEVSIKFKSEVRGEKKLEKLAQSLRTIKGVLSGIDEGKLKVIEKSAGSIQEVSKQSSEVGKKLNLAFDATVVKRFINGLENVYKTMVKLSAKSSEYLENINLFQVAFDGNYKSAEKFMNTMTEMYGLDESWAIRTIGIFRQLANAMNLSAETGTRLSTLLTQMSVDISSLYNVDIERASSTLQSALAGQTKPIRGTTGADITQTTLQTTLDNLGIQQQIANLSYAEKRLIIIVSLTQQLTQSIGDFGRTIESPANQLRILDEQFSRLSRSVGNLFLPVLSKILPFLNAIVMVLTEIVSTIASLFGYKEEDYDYFAGMADSVLELEEGFDGAAESAEKLKHGLRGFDKLNVITTPSSGSSGIGGGAGGIDPAIMDAFNKAYDDYFKKLDKVEMKATKIRDKVMDWLGFQKQINEETGDVYFTLDKSDLKVQFIGTLISKIANSPEFLALKLGFQGIKSILEYFGSSGVKDVDKLGNVSEETAKRLQPLETAFNNLKTTISGISYDGLALTNDEKNKIVDSINSLTDALKTALNDYIIQQISNLNYLYKTTGTIDEEEYNRRLKELEEYQQKQLGIIDEHDTILKEKSLELYDENGNIIMSKLAEYQELLQQYETQSYQDYTAGEQDKLQLQQNMQEASKNEQIKYYSELMQAYAKDRDNAIEAAQKKKDETINAAKELYGESSTQYQEQYKLAEENYNKEVEAAETAYNDIYNSFKTSNEDIATYIDQDSGGLLSGFERTCNKLKTTFGSTVTDIVTTWASTTFVGKTIKIGAQIIDLFKKDGGIYSGGAWHDVAKYAGGGLPPVGQMFVARESGPELVGKIGSSTAVLNNNQIVDSVAAGVYSAVKAANSQPQVFNIYLDENHKIGSYTLQQLQGMAKTNGKPITIGG